MHTQPSYFEALSVTHAAVEAAGIPLPEAAFRWLSHHSLLSAEHGDGIIIGGSSVRHMESNLAAVAHPGPLPEAVVAAFDEGWRLTEAEVPCYYRGENTAASE
jgi:aflatoxin B1 aldehyde reductase